MSNDSKSASPEQSSTQVRFGKVDARIFRDKALPSTVKLVYVALVTYADTDRTAFPSRATLAADTGLSVRTVDAAIKAGEKAGIFTVERRRVGKTNRANRYRLHDLNAAGGSAAVAPPSAGAAPELDHVSRPQTSSSLAARPRPGGRGRQSKPKSDPRAERRADYPTNNDWIGDSWDETVENILDHVGGGPAGLANVLYDKITPPVDMETYEELPFIREPTPRWLMNIALKATRWDTVNFAYIKEQERLGRGPDWVPTVRVVRDVWDEAS